MSTSRLPAVLARGRAMAQARMLSRVAVRRRTGATVILDGLKVPVWVVVHPDLPFRLDDGSNDTGGTRSVTIGGVTYQSATAVGHLPAATPDLRDDDLCEVTSGEWAGTVWRISKAVAKDQATARRLPIEQVARPVEWS